MQNFKLTIEYDGTAYHGWQRQKNDPTVQGAIEKALHTMTGATPTLIGSGRTDAGVHALGQVAHFAVDSRLTPESFQAGLNSLLPDDIVILECRRAAPEFHARYDVKTKTYHYRILNRTLPHAIGRQYAWHVRRPLDTPAMQAALAHVAGRHDFKAFEGTGSPRAHTVRLVSRSVLTTGGAGDLTVEIEADGFLRYMVRNIVGTVVDVGLGRKRPADVAAILASQDRGQAGATAPAHGLFLVRVTY